MIQKLSVKIRLGKQMKRKKQRCVYLILLFIRVCIVDIQVENIICIFCIEFILKQFFKVLDMVYFFFFVFNKRFYLQFFKYLFVFLVFIIVYFILKWRFFKMNYFEVICFCYIVVVCLKMILMYCKRYLILLLVRYFNLYIYIQSFGYV